jgi:hypothetical protein
MRALPGAEAQTALEAEQAARVESSPQPAKRPRRAPRRRAPVRQEIAPRYRPAVRERERSHEEVVDLLGMEGVLNLDDAPTVATDTGRPWVRGLRG